MKKIVIILSCLLLLVTVTGATLSCGNGNDKTEPQTKIVWRLAGSAVTGTLQDTLLREFAEKVKADSNGQLEIRIFSGGSLYSMTEIFDAVTSRAVDLGQTGVTTYLGKEPKTGSGSAYTSVMSDNITQTVAMNTALANEWAPMITEANRDKINHLFWGASGSIDMFFKFPVNTMADLAGKKIGGVPGVASAIKAMGATPVPMDLADFYLSAKTGLVDGWALCPLENYASMKFYEVAPYLVNLQYYAAFSVLVNQDSFDALPADLQEIVKTAGIEIQTKWISQVEASDADILRQMKANSNVNVKILTPAERSTWFDKALTPVFSGMLTAFATADEATEAKAILARVKATGK